MYAPKAPAQVSRVENRQLATSMPTGLWVHDPIDAETSFPEDNARPHRQPGQSPPQFRQRRGAASGMLSELSFALAPRPVTAPPTNQRNSQTEKAGLSAEQQKVVNSSSSPDHQWMAGAHQLDPSGGDRRCQHPATDAAAWSMEQSAHRFRLQAKNSVANRRLPPWPERTAAGHRWHSLVFRSTNAGWPCPLSLKHDSCFGDDLIWN